MVMRETDMSMNTQHVDGKDKGSVLLFALSTCVWCKRTKRLLSELGVAYDYIDVDLLEGEEKDAVHEELAKWNKRRSYPTIIVNEEQALISYDEDKIREVLGDD